MRKVIRDIMSRWLARMVSIGHAITNWLMILRTCAPGGPVGSPLDVGICRGVPLSERDETKTRYVPDNVELSLRTPGLLAPAITVTRWTDADQ